ncbi:MAG: hypothetical protein Q4B68_02615 [Bacteroidales bacterium]|nr:hypothetical protein [Bacteroidales bacterium]
MKKTVLTLVPTEGLANRMRAWASAIAFTERHGMALNVVWRKCSNNNCLFSDLFKPLSEAVAPHVRLVDGGAAAQWLYDQPMKRNLHLPRLWHALKYGVRIYFHHMRSIAQQYEGAAREQHVLNLVGEGDALVFSCYPLCDYPDALNASVFRPTDEIEARIQQRAADFAPSMIGVHIRRTDNAMAIKSSPISLFEHHMRQALEQYPGAHFYLATDDERVKRHMEHAFPGKIHTSPAPADRTSAEGMKEAAVEMFTLARCNHFIGSYYSSFSDMVLALNGAKGLIAKTD